jgi:hypothetical protein
MQCLSPRPNWRIWTNPPPLPQASAFFHPNQKGGGESLADGEGCGNSNSDGWTKIYTVKKRFRGFPFPSRDVTYQTLSRREYVSLFKPEVFLFPCWNSHRIPFPDIPLLQAGILPRSLITHLCTCPQPEIFPYFPLLGSFPLSI